MYEYYSPLGDLGMAIFFVALGIGLLIGLCSIFLKNRSGRYREDLINMYVAATIRKIAKEDKIDLNEEYEIFKKWAKKRKLEEKGLDYAIEEDLKDKIVDKTQQEFEKEKKN